ncbi:hypothetical protein U27_07083 [Candidatus Vecturithrix granuli]|uniref:Uncharacterized protein n=1 Tax=Vecturithrix granuli TaxID=1499967 RepID=A0A081C690_VECG1|nr:hypothetical protein U27_07083 [Candidatus Vecturithrix granuli]
MSGSHPIKITFNKAEDEFTAHCLLSILNLAQVSSSRVSHKEQEKLFSNLLKIQKMPDQVWSVPCKVKQPQDILMAVEGYIPPFTIVGKNLYTFESLRSSACIFREFREGKYPPLRGTYFTIENRHHFLYTMGFVPYLETYPKPHVPTP